MDKINILHVYQNSKIGGIQQQILSLLKEYDREVFNPAFCCLGPKGEIGKEIENLGFDFTALNRERYHRFSPGIVIALYKLIKRKRIHVLRTHKYRANLYGRLAGRLAGVPVIISSLHIDYGAKDRYTGRRIMNRLLSRVSDRIVAVSESVKRDSVRYDGIEPERVLVIRNGVDTRRFSAGQEYNNAGEEFSIKKEDMVIGFVGRIVQSKGLQYLIEAASLLKGQYDNLKFLLVGDGSLVNELKEQAREKGVFKNVIFAGSRRDISAFLSRFNIFVMPSVKEGLPNSLLEAMAMGKPVIAAGVGGIPEVINNGVNGLLVPPGDAGRLAESIKRLIENEGMAAGMGQAARDFIAENYSIKSTALKWQSLYVSLLRQKGFKV